jgi:hypothetical protein
MTMLQHFEGCHVQLFVETGTAEGNTLDFASRCFERCLSIESNERLYMGAIERFKEIPNVRIFHGYSPHILRDILEPSMPTTFWLDAHYSGQGNTLVPGHGECPLLEELEVIAKVPWETTPIILIDDAFMFDDSVNAPGSKYPFWGSNETDCIVYHKAQWPRVEEIDTVLAGYTRSMLTDENAFRYERT